MELSKGYYFSDDDLGYGLVIREADKDVITSIEDLKDKVVMAQSGSLQEALTNDNIPKYKEFKRVSSMQDAFLAVQEGKADVATVDVENAKLYIQNNPECGMMVVPDVYFKLEEQYDGTRIGAPKGEIALMYFVNGVIDEILESGQYEEWFKEYTEYAGTLGI